MQLLPHQKAALAWMSQREMPGGPLGPPCGGILADDQGLGKTVTTIALLMTNRPGLQQQGLPTLEALAPQRQHCQQRLHGSCGTTRRASSVATSKEGSPTPLAQASEDGSSSSNSESSSTESSSSSSSSSSSDEESSSSSSDEEEAKEMQEVIQLSDSSTGQQEQRKPQQPQQPQLQGGTLIVCPTAGESAVLLHIQC